MKSTCWDTRAKDSIIKSGQKDTEASINHLSFYVTRNPPLVRLIESLLSKCETF